jgi:putative ABC transport system permease protein
MWQDIRLAFRTLAKNRGFAAVAVTALALGIGANATVFSLVNAILFKNLAFTDSERVLYITSFNPKNPRGNEPGLPAQLPGSARAGDAGSAGKDKPFGMRLGAVRWDSCC